MIVTLPCIACGKALESAFPDDVGGTTTASPNQPNEGTAFVSYGHYGSTVFDPDDGTFLEINVCDECLMRNPDWVLHARKHRPRVRYEYFRWNPNHLSYPSAEPTDVELGLE